LMRAAVFRMTTAASSPQCEKFRRRCPSLDPSTAACQMLLVLRPLHALSNSPKFSVVTSAKNSRW
jgi:hypothetical protein